MALRGALTHRKTRCLAESLGISQCFALGIMEALWHATAMHAPNGAIGRLTNQAIADEMYYTGNALKLINALVAAELIDRDVTHRLIVHNWHVRSDDSLNVKLCRAGQRFAGGQMPRATRLSKQERQAANEKFGLNQKTLIGQADGVRTNAHKSAPPEPEPIKALAANPQSGSQQIRRNVLQLSLPADAEPSNALPSGRPQLRPRMDADGWVAIGVSK